MREHHEGRPLDKCHETRNNGYVGKTDKEA